MHNVKICALVVSLLMAWSPSVTATDRIQMSGGVPLEKAEVEQWSMTVYQDGRNLPAGSGDALNGETLYQTHCVSCHGQGGKKGDAPRLVGPAGYPEGRTNLLETFSVGAWPYATTIFDYVRRGMPHYAPKTLSDSDVYSLTAYILHLNGLVEKDAQLNRETLMKVEMPTRKKAFSAWEVYENGELRDSPLQP